MNFKLIKIWKDSGEDIYQMLQQILWKENWIINEMYWKTIEDFQQRKIDKENESLWIWLKPERVKVGTFCFFVDDKPLWIGKLRHKLNESLMIKWWNISYILVEAARGKGYWTKILELLLIKAKGIWLKKVLLTCEKDNIWSYKIIEKNNGILENIIEWERRYWIQL